MDRSPPPNLIGPFLIASMLNWALFGTLSIQTYLFSLARRLTQARGPHRSRTSQDYVSAVAGRSTGQLVDLHISTADLAQDAYHPRAARFSGISDGQQSSPTTATPTSTFPSHFNRLAGPSTHAPTHTKAHSPSVPRLSNESIIIAFATYSVFVLHLLYTCLITVYAWKVADGFGGPPNPGESWLLVSAVDVIGPFIFGLTAPLYAYRIFIHYSSVAATSLPLRNCNRTKFGLKPKAPSQRYIESQQSQPFAIRGLGEYLSALLMEVTSPGGYVFPAVILLLTAVVCVCGIAYGGRMFNRPLTLGQRAPFDSLQAVWLVGQVVINAILFFFLFKIFNFRKMFRPNVAEPHNLCPYSCTAITTRFLFETGFAQLSLSIASLALNIVHSSSKPGITSSVFIVPAILLPALYGNGLVLSLTRSYTRMILYVEPCSEEDFIVPKVQSGTWDVPLTEVKAPAEHKTVEKKLRFGDLDSDSVSHVISAPPPAKSLKGKLSNYSLASENRDDKVDYSYSIGDGSGSPSAAASTSGDHYYKQKPSLDLNDGPGLPDPAATWAGGSRSSRGWRWSKRRSQILEPAVEPYPLTNQLRGAHSLDDMGRKRREGKEALPPVAVGTLSSLQNVAMRPLQLLTGTPRVRSPVQRSRDLNGSTSQAGSYQPGPKEKISPVTPDTYRSPSTWKSGSTDDDTHETRRRRIKPSGPRLGGERRDKGKGVAEEVWVDLPARTRFSPGSDPNSPENLTSSQVRSNIGRRSGSVDSHLSSNQPPHERGSRRHSLDRPPGVAINSHPNNFPYGQHQPIASSSRTGHSYGQPVNPSYLNSSYPEGDDQSVLIISPVNKDPSINEPSLFKAASVAATRASTDSLWSTYTYPKPMAFPDLDEDLRLGRYPPDFDFGSPDFVFAPATHADEEAEVIVPPPGQANAEQPAHVPESRDVLERELVRERLREDERRKRRWRQHPLKRMVEMGNFKW